MEDLYQKADDVSEVFGRLHSKFESNFEKAIGLSTKKLISVELKARALSMVGSILKKAKCTPTQTEVASLLDVVFADTTCSICLAAYALDTGARMVLRRVLELGVATVYLWDLPHLFWAWKQHDRDLNFNDMLDHIGSEGFKAYVASINPTSRGSDLMDFQEARKSIAFSAM